MEVATIFKSTAISNLSFYESAEPRRKLIESNARKSKREQLEISELTPLYVMNKQAFKFLILEMI